MFAVEQAGQFSQWAASRTASRHASVRSAHGCPMLSRCPQPSHLCSNQWSKVWDMCSSKPQRRFTMLQDGAQQQGSERRCRRRCPVEGCLYIQPVDEKRI